MTQQIFSIIYVGSVGEGVIGSSKSPDCRQVISSRICQTGVGKEQEGAALEEGLTR